MSPFKVLDEVIQKRAAPPLRYVGYQQAKLDYTWLVVRDTLTVIGFSAHDASVLANSVKGSPRERLAKLIRQKRVIVIPKSFKIDRM